MKTVLPERIEISAEVDEHGLYHMRMQEWYPSTPEAIAATVAMLKAKGLDVEQVAEDSLVLTQTGPPEAVGDLLVGEFLLWSTLGSMTLRDILVQALAL